MRAFLALIVCVACGPKLDPLHPMKSELALAKRNAGKGPAHVRVALSRPATEAIVQTALGAGEPLVFPIMMGTAAKVTPTLRPLEFSIGPSDACDCPRADFGLRGTVDVEVSGLLGSNRIANDLGFRATARGAAQLSLERTKDRSMAIALMPVRRDPWALQIRLDKSEGLITDKLVANQVTAPIGELLSKPIPLFKLPQDLPVKPARVSLEVAEIPLGAVWLQAKPGDPVPAPTPKKGWAVATNDANALAGIRAAMSSVKQHKRWKIEPTGIGVEPGRFTADIRVHKVARRAKYRDYSIDGRIDFGKQTIDITPETVVETGKKGWGLSLVGPLVKGQVRKRVLANALSFPSSIERKVGQGQATFTVEGLRSKGDRIVVHGSVE